MNTRARSLLGSLGLTLAIFAVVSAFTLGAAAAPTLISFGLLAIYGLVELTVLSYASPGYIFLEREEPAATGEVIEYPATTRAPIDRAA